MGFFKKLVRAVTAPIRAVGKAANINELKTIGQAFVKQPAPIAIPTITTPAGSTTSDFEAKTAAIEKQMAADTAAAAKAEKARQEAAAAEAARQAEAARKARIDAENKTAMQNQITANQFAANSLYGMNETQQAIDANRAPQIAGAAAASGVLGGAPGGDASPSTPAAAIGAYGGSRAPRGVGKGAKFANQPGEPAAASNKFKLPDTQGLSLGGS